MTTSIQAATSALLGTGVAVALKRSNATQAPTLPSREGLNVTLAQKVSTVKTQLFGLYRALTEPTRQAVRPTALKCQLA
jgi:hypothetical protein